MKIQINIFYFAGLLMVVAVLGWMTGFLTREHQERSAATAMISQPPRVAIGAPLDQPSSGPALPLMGGGQPR
jgi:hypothetical protein